MQFVIEQQGDPEVMVDMQVQSFKVLPKSLTCQEKATPIQAVKSPSNLINIIFAFARPNLQVSSLQN